MHNYPDQDREIELLSIYRDTQSLEVLAELFMPLMHLVYGTCLKYLEDREQAKDAVQDIYQLISRDLLKTEVKQFKSWLYVVTKNHCYMILRKMKRENESLKNFSLDQSMENESIDHLFTEDTGEIELSSLQKCMEKLKELQNKCVDMFYLQGMSYQEVSDLLTISFKEVKSHIQNGKRNLKNCIEQQINEAK